MSDTVPDRRISGLTPRTPSSGPDLSRLQRRNRVTPPATAPTPPTEPSPPQPAEPVLLATAAAPITGDSPPAATPRPVKKPATKTPKTRTAPPPATATVTMSTYIESGLRARARAAYRATSHLEGDTSWSDFVAHAIQAEVERRERRHNGGDEYPGETTALRPGRPLQ
jgi:hypothetical protein